MKNIIITKYILNLHIVHIKFYHACLTVLDVSKSTDRTAKSVDPDHRSSLIWVYTVCSALLFRMFSIIFYPSTPYFF